MSAPLGWLAAIWSAPRLGWHWLTGLCYRPAHRAEVDYSDYISGTTWARETYAIDTGQMRAIEPARSYALGDTHVFDPDDWREDWTADELAQLRDGLEDREDWAVATLEAEDFAPVLGEQWLHAHWWWYSLEAAREADEYHNLIAAERLAWRREMGLPIDLERVAA